MRQSARSLDDWLHHAEGVHALGIDMGLERVGQVADRLGFVAPERRPAPRSVIVAGTNGKGSTCIALETLLIRAGLRVGTTLSPHLHRFNERVRIDGEEVDDGALCDAFAAVEEARSQIPLTYFEFSALVALCCFRSAAVDLAILEVGLGGRLDAFNLVSADVAIVTSIGLDHQAYLGDDLEGIGREKAGVLRRGQHVVLGRDVTRSVTRAATDLACTVRRLGEDFHALERALDWDFRGTLRADRLRRGDLAPHNCALALEAAAWLGELPEGSAEALASVRMPGRCETWRLQAAGRRLLVVDVAHNPAGAGFLRQQLALRWPGRRFVAMTGMLADKDSAGVASAMADAVRAWVCVPTPGPRGLAAADLAARLGADERVVTAGDPVDGLEQALSLCQPGDAILAFGSFSLVERVRNLLAGGFADARQVGWQEARVGEPDVPELDSRR
ncbi:MAG: bifunctional tetrahydrofolate synthase/dihydrofolate synthase [Pseudomonadales bacterium]